MPFLPFLYGGARLPIDGGKEVPRVGGSEIFPLLDVALHAVHVVQPLQGAAVVRVQLGVAAPEVSEGGGLRQGEQQDGRGEEEEQEGRGGGGGQAHREGWSRRYVWGEEAGKKARKRLVT